MRPFILAIVLTLAAIAIAQPAHAQATPAKPGLAVLYFDYKGSTESLGVLKKGLAQMLITDLTTLDGVQLVERDRLEDILKELDLGRTARVDRKTAARIGKLLGARYTIVGDYFDLGATLRIDARLLDVETGAILDSIGVSGTADDFMDLQQRLAEQLGESLTETLATRAAKPATKPVRRPARKAPAKVPQSTALRYARALDAKDRGDLGAATKELQAAVKESPSFELAADELAAIMK